MTLFRSFLLVVAAGIVSTTSWAQVTKSLDAYDVKLTPACFNTPYDDFATRKLGDKLFVLSAAKNACEDIDMDEFSKKTLF